jgi:hypothetical protein
VTDPYLVTELKAKLDSQALYDGFEVDRVARVALKGSKARPSVRAGRGHHAGGEPAAEGLCRGEARF